MTFIKSPASVIALGAHHIGM